MIEPEAKAAAWRAALAVAQSRRNLAAAKLTEAQLEVIRRCLYELMPGGEVEFWERVEKELRR